MVNLISREEWNATEPNEVSWDFTPYEGGVAIHHTGPNSSIDANHGMCGIRVLGIQRQHKLFGGYDDIAYNYVVCVHGYSFVGRGLQVRSGANGTQTPGANQNYYAILGMMGSPDPVSTAMVNEIRSLIIYLRQVGQSGPAVVGHRDLFSTECPGRLYPYVQSGALNPSNPPGGGGDDRPPPPGGGGGNTAPPWPGVLFTNPPPTEHYSVTTWQARMQERGWNIVPDGVYGDQSQLVCEQFQAEKGLGVDGIVGAQTWTAAWEAPITPGVPGGGGSAPPWPGVLFTYPPETVHTSVRTWQNQMIARGWNIGLPDSIYGPQSKLVCEEFQAEKNLGVDGIVGEQTWRASWEAPIT